MIAKQRGFTILELIVAMSIISLLATSILVGYGNLRERRDLKIASDNLVSNLEKMSSFSLLNRDIDSTTQAYAYALEFSSDSARNGYYNLLAYDRSFPAPGRQTVLQAINLPANTSISSISVARAGGGGAITPGRLILFFTVPYARVLQTYYDSGGVVLSEREKDSITTVTISNSSGARSVEINGITGAITRQ